MTKTPRIPKPDKTLLAKSAEAVAYWLVGGSLALAGAIKIANPENFLVTLESIDILPRSLNYLIAYCLPLLEILIGYMLLFKSLRRTGILIALGLYLGFSIWLLIANIYKLPISCGCFGAWDPLESNPLGALIRAMILLALSVWLWLRSSNK